MLQRAFLSLFFLAAACRAGSELWSLQEGALRPYLLPENHPAKPILDRIFKDVHSSYSIETMKQAGFIAPQLRKWTHVVVTRHPDLSGYVIKAYMDTYGYHQEQPAYKHWVKRIQGARLLRTLIQKLEAENTFKVPKKWIYLLPGKAKSFNHCVLIEEDMHILRRSENKKMWASEAVTEETLELLARLLQKGGLRDCTKPSNIPFARDGKIAFIDTETHGSWPIRYHRLTPALSSKNQRYWKKLSPQ